MMVLGEARIYLCREAVDFRKSINGLSLLVAEVLGHNPLSSHWFVFSNRRRNKIKILYWQRTGFCLWLKRLEQDRFIWPKEEETVIELSTQQLRWLLEGYNLNVMKPHPTRCYDNVT